jgi:bifunctional UDP-N-acetylglucosamine pyrophosphorylase / glucosamine-1-phosphate N-acetyltransferase
MAAGLGTRMRSSLPKVLHPMCGRPMLAYVLDAWATTADGATGAPPVVVYSPPVAAITEAFDGQATFALQDEPRGTGDAVRAAMAAVP